MNSNLGRTSVENTVASLFLSDLFLQTPLQKTAFVELLRTNRGALPLAGVRAPGYVGGMPSNAPPSQWLSARLCSLSYAKLQKVVRRVARLDPSLNGVQSHVLRYALMVTVLNPPLAAALRDVKCARGNSAPVRAAPITGDEGAAFAYSLNLLSSCYPEGSVHQFVEHGLLHGEDLIVRLLTRATVAEQTAFFSDVLARTAYDLRPSLAARFDRG